MWTFILLSFQCALAQAQMVPIDSLSKVRLIPDVVEINPIQEEHLMAVPKGKNIYSRAEVVFTGSLERVFSSFYFNSMTILFGACFIPEGSTACEQGNSAEIDFRRTDQEFTRWYLVKNSRELEDFSFWAQDRPSILIVGGDAWRILAQMGMPEDAGIIYRSEIACAKSVRFLSGKEVSEVSCLIPLDGIKQF